MADVNCQNCMKPYISRSGPNRRLPLLLPCGHTFCEVCVSRWIKSKLKRGMFFCTLCQEPHHFNGSAEKPLADFAIDAYILGLLTRQEIGSSEGPGINACDRLLRRFDDDTVSAQMIASNALLTPVAADVNSSDMCSSCQTSVALGICPCGQFCQGCFDVLHSRSKALARHDFRLFVRSECVVHRDSMIELWCTDHVAPICSTCFVTKHKGCSVVNVKEAREDLSSLLSSQQRQLISAKDVMAGADKKIDGLLSVLKGDCKDARKSIMVHFCELHSKLQRSLDVSLAKLESSGSARLEELLSAKREIQSRMTQCLESELWLSRATQPNAQLDVLLKAHMNLNSAVGTHALDFVVDEAATKLMFEKNQDFSFEDVGTIVGSSGRGVLSEVALPEIVLSRRQQQLSLHRNAASRSDSASPKPPLFVAPAVAEAGARSGYSPLTLTMPLDRKFTPVPSTFASTGATAGSSAESSQFNAPASSTEDWIQMKVVSVVTPSRYVMQHMSDQAAIEHISSQLAMEHVNGRLERLNVLRKGDIVAASFSEDSCWYRARIQSLASDANLQVAAPPNAHARVEYIDFGNFEWVSLTQLRVLPLCFLDSRPYCLKCSLHQTTAMTNTSMSAADFYDTIFTFVSGLISDATVGFKVLAKDSKDVFYGDVLPPGSEKPLREIFVEKQYAVVNTSLPSAIEEVGLDEETVDVNISHCISPVEFYVTQGGEWSEMLENLMSDLQDAYSGENIPAPPIIRQGVLCCVQYAADGKWYRGVVKKLEFLGAIVQYIDFGNCERVDWSMIRVLEPTFALRPALATRCFAANLQPVNSASSWPLEACEKWQELCQDQYMVLLRRGGRVADKGYPVVLIDTSGDMDIYPAKLMVDAKMARQSAGVMETADPQLQQAQSKEEQPWQPLQHLSHPALDSGLAQVSSSPSSAMDETLTNSSAIRSAAKSLPLTSAPNVHIKPLAAGASTSVVDVESLRLLHEQKLYGQQQQKQQQQQNQQQENAYKAVQSLQTPALPPSAWATSFGLSALDLGRYNMPTTSVEGCYLYSPNSFFVQLQTEDLDVLKQVLMGQLDKFSRETVATSPAGGWQVGHLCVAPYLSGDEETWNRCVLKSIMDVNAEVYFADFGNTESVPLACLRPLPASYATLPAQAIHCSLCRVCAPADDKLKGDACEALDDEFKYLLDILVLGERVDGVLPVDLLSRRDDSRRPDQSVSDILVMLGLASEVTDATAFSPRDSYNHFLPPAEDEFWMRVTHISRDGCLYGNQILTGGKQSSLHNLEQRMRSALESQHDPDTVPSFCWRGQAGCVFSHDSAGWFRCQLLQVLPDLTLEVLLIDKGITSTVNLFDFIAVPFDRDLCSQAIQCSIKLADLQEGGELSEDDFVKLSSVVMHKQCLVRQQSVSSARATDGSPLPAEVFLPNNVSVQEAFAMADSVALGPLLSSCSTPLGVDTVPADNSASSITSSHYLPPHLRGITGIRRGAGSADRSVDLASPEQRMPTGPRSLSCNPNDDSLFHSFSLASISEEHLSNAIPCDRTDSGLEDQVKSSPLKDTLTSLKFEQEIADGYVAMPMPGVGCMMQVRVSDVTTPDEFYVQILSSDTRTPEQCAQEQSAVAAACTRLASPPSSLGPLAPPLIPGMPCLAQFMGASLYRAVILHCADGKADIKSVDYGSCSYGEDISSLRTIPPDLRQIPPQATRVKISGIEPPEHKEDMDVIPGTMWPKQALAFLISHLESKELTATVKRCSSPLEISLDVDGASVGDILISSGLAKRQEGVGSSDHPVAPVLPASSDHAAVESPVAVATPKLNALSVSSSVESSASVLVARQPMANTGLMCPSDFAMDDDEVPASDHCQSLLANTGFPATASSELPADVDLLATQRGSLLLGGTLPDEPSASEDLQSVGEVGVSASGSLHAATDDDTNSGDGDVLVIDEREVSSEDDGEKEEVEEVRRVQVDREDGPFPTGRVDPSMCSGIYGTLPDTTCGSTVIGSEDSTGIISDTTTLSKPSSCRGRTISSSVDP